MRLNLRSYLPSALRHPGRTGIGAAGAAIALLVAACSGGPATSPPSSAQLGATPTTTVTTPTPTPAGSPVAVGPIVEGKYLSEPNDAAGILARIKADTKLTPAETAEWVKNYSKGPDQIVGLEFKDGGFIETEAVTASASSEIGARGRYALADGKTLALAGIGTFAITPTSNGFALKLVKQELPGEVELLLAKILFESSQFTLDRPAAQAISDGTYVGRSVPISELAVLVSADKKLTPAQRQDLSELTTGHTTMQVQLGFHAGAFTEAVAFDGGAFQIGVRATYAFSDDRTLVTQSPSVDTFAVTWASGGFSLRRTSTPADEGDAMFGKILFQNTAFTLVP